MISKECFIKQIEAIDKYMVFVGSFPYWIDTVDAPFYNIVYEIIDSLSEELEGISGEDSSIFQWYFSFDKGRYYEITSNNNSESDDEGLMTFEGKVYSPTTAGELYDNLMEIHNKLIEGENNG